MEFVTFEQTCHVYLLEYAVAAVYIQISICSAHQLPLVLALGI